MTTTPKNQDALRHNALQPAERQPTPGELLWTLRKGTQTKTAELRTHAGGVELQLSRNGEWYYGRRHERRAFALEDAAAARRQLEQDGWIQQRLEGSAAG